jgi:hypothetical protein
MKQEVEIKEKESDVFCPTSEKQWNLTLLSEIEMDADEMEYNGKLENISFIVSNQIRGPVATMLGLLGLIRRDVLRHDELFQVYFHLEKCVNELEVKCKELDELSPERLLAPVFSEL